MTSVATPATGPTNGPATVSHEGGALQGFSTIFLAAIQESARRRVLLVVGLLSLGFLGLFAAGNVEAFHSLSPDSSNHLTSSGLDEHALAAAVLLGLGMFSTLFLGTVLGAFLTLGVVRGDAERGLLQPLVVRPVGRLTLLFARWLAAVAVCTVYVIVLYLAEVLIVRLASGHPPPHLVAPVVSLVAAVATIVALALLGSVFLTSTANGIAVFMAFGAGLVGGLLYSIGLALHNDTLTNVAHGVSWALPFEALYQSGLHDLLSTSNSTVRTLLELGPFGASRAGGPWLWPWVLGWLAVVGLLTMRAFVRRDL